MSVRQEISQGSQLKYKPYIAMVLLGLLWGHSPAYAEIYKWRDAQGVMNYSDTPPPANVQHTQKIKATTVPNDLPLTRSDAYPVEGASSSAKAPERSETRESQANNSAEAQALKAMEERVRAQNCAAARSNYRNYAIGGRMQSVNEEGEKEFLNDAQIQEGLARAQQEIDANCPLE